MNNDTVVQLLVQFNEWLTAATVIVAASMLLYNLSNGLNDRVARASAILLGCVTASYIGNVFIALARTNDSIVIWLRFKWIGIAFAPAALFHLSASLLATTGLISRGRRRRVVRILYLYGIVFLLMATGTDLLVIPPASPSTDAIRMFRPGPLLWLYLTYFGFATVFALNNVRRARQRCLTRATHRRMTYLLAVFLTPVIGIFPYTLLFSQPTGNQTFWLWALINIGNIGIILMLMFMAYPLSFFGPNKPDRQIRADLLRFMLRGPVTGMLVLMVILFVPATRVLGLPGLEFMPFAAVATVLTLQWAFDFVIPFLERLLVYTPSQDQARQIREFSERLLTRADAHQLLETILAAICDYLRVPSAFIASVNSTGAHLEQVVGPLSPSQTWLSSPQFMDIANSEIPEGLHRHGEIMAWESFWLVPLRSTRTNGSGNGHNGQHRLIGVMGVWARSAQPDLLAEEEKVFGVLYNRAARILDDMRLQEEVFSVLENVMKETSTIRRVPEEVRYGNVAALTSEVSAMADDPDFVNVVRNALRDYWGGPRLTESRLMELNIVSRALEENEGNPARAVRAVLTRAIESLKPEGQRSLTTAEWILYNILEMRFIQGRKVSDVAPRLAMSEADLFRKQKYAIEQTARKIAEMEQQELENKHNNHGGNGNSKGSPAEPPNQSPSPAS